MIGQADTDDSLSLSLEVFSKQMFILGFKYKKSVKHTCQLMNFSLGHSKMATYVTRKGMIDDLIHIDYI